MTFVDYIIALLYIVGLTFLLTYLPFFRIKFAKRSLLISFWMLKVFATIAFFLIYSFYEPYKNGNDSLVYYKDGGALFQLAKTNQSSFLRLMTGVNINTEDENYTKSMNYWNRPYDSVVPNDNRTIIRINAILHFVSFNNYLVHLILMSFFSFIGLMALYKSVLLCCFEHRWKAVLPIFIIPSTLFWSSGNIKEPILVFALGLSLFFYFKILNKCFAENKGLNFTELNPKQSFLQKMNSLNIFTLVFFVISMLLLFSIKSYVFMLLIPILFAHFLYLRFKKFGALVYYIAGFGIWISLGLLLAYIRPSYSFVYLIYEKNINFITMLDEYGSGSTFTIPVLQNSFWSIVSHSPEGLLNALTRPLIWESEIWTKQLAAIENIVLLIAALFFLFSIKWKLIKDNNFFWFCMFLAVSLLILSGLVTPNMGALVRYKSPALPFLFLALTLHSNRMVFVENKLINIFGLKK